MRAPSLRHEDVLGRAPAPDENPWGAWAWRARAEGAEEGPLRGLRLAIKDNTAVAGMPMRAGSRLLDGHTPRAHATVVRRLLDAGADVVGKAACEDLCFSGGSHTGAGGLVRNPCDPSRMAGGSSSGSAVLVAAGLVEAATGTDQGGSVTIPAAWCGVVGLKPTYGLVPYTGIVPLAPELDHVGFLARRVEVVARLLDAAAGADGVDPRQGRADATRPPEAGARHARAAMAAARGPFPPRVGELREGFGRSASEPEVDACVRGALRRWARAAGGRVVEASVPAHSGAAAAAGAVAARGVRDLLLRGPAWRDPVLPDLGGALRQGLLARGDALSPTVRRALRAHEASGAAARALAGRASLREAYDAALRHVDVLALPTVPFRPTLFPAPDAPLQVVVAAAETNENTAPFDLTGHPALSLPAGTVGGLPVGVLLVGRRFEEAALLGAGASFEASQRRSDSSFSSSSSPRP